MAVESLVRQPHILPEKILIKSEWKHEFSACLCKTIRIFKEIICLWLEAYLKLFKSLKATLQPRTHWSTFVGTVLGTIEVMSHETRSLYPRHLCVNILRDNLIMTKRCVTFYCRHCCCCSLEKTFRIWYFKGLRNFLVRLRSLVDLVLGQTDASGGHWSTKAQSSG